MKIKYLQAEVDELRRTVTALRDNLNGQASTCGASGVEVFEGVKDYKLYIDTWVLTRIDNIADELKPKGAK